MSTLHAAKKVRALALRKGSGLGHLLAIQRVDMGIIDSAHELKCRLLLVFRSCALEEIEGQDDFVQVDMATWTWKKDDEGSKQGHRECKGLGRAMGLKRVTRIETEHAWRYLQGGNIVLAVSFVSGTK